MIGRMREAVRERQRQGAFEPVAKRIRALLDGVTVVDSTRSALVWEPRRVVPSYAVPEADILGDVVPDLPPAPPDDGIPTLHPGIPFAVRAPGGPDAAEGHRRADPAPAGMVVLETSLPMRAYTPRDDVRMDLLVPSVTRTACAHRGQARYWSPEGAGAAGEDLAWSYEAPLREAGPVTDLIAFFDERTDVTVGGVPQERPNTPWSPTWTAA